MPLTLNIDRFTRMSQSVSGSFAPSELPNLAGYLAAPDGEISYSLVGNLAVDAAGSQERRVKCIISGWFLLFDPVTLDTVRHSMDISSSLILVDDESALPPLEMESENEDYIVCGASMIVAERVEEEILLNLPAQAVNRSEALGSRQASTTGSTAKLVRTSIASESILAGGDKISPFAKLAKLKKK
jgi:uncharacterized metal-binding protein YceD (DUF177 family)